MTETLHSVALLLIAVPVLLVGYSYVGYPLLLSVLGKFRGLEVARPNLAAGWPMISISVPVYNEARQIRGTVESLLRLDYPVDRRQILIISDASNDGTDEIVAEYRNQGVELLKMPTRSGKTAAENAARPLLRGEIIVNTDASIRISRDALKPLIAPFQDPSVGVASGRDISTTNNASEANVGESRYVGYEMWVRSLETRVGGIVGASGCLYAIRRHLHEHAIPPALSRDFASALTARKYGMRAVSVDEATCRVPRGPSLRGEYRRKVRTMTRGLETLFFRRELLNPLRFGIFGWMLFSHKLCRWLVPWAAILGAGGVVLLAAVDPTGRWLLATALLLCAAAGIGWIWPEGHRPPRILSVPAFLFAGNFAALHAWIRVCRGELNPIWEPTRRESTPAVAVSTPR